MFRYVQVQNMSFLWLCASTQSISEGLKWDACPKQIIWAKYCIMKEIGKVDDFLTAEPTNNNPPNEAHVAR